MAKIKQNQFNTALYKKIILFVVFVVLLFAFTNKSTSEKISNAFHSTMVNNGFAVKDVILYGRKNSYKDEILKQTNIEYGQSIFSIDVNEIKQNIEKISWIKSVSVERQFPNRINIKIKERKPIAIWQLNKKHYIIDKNGTVITDKDIEKFSYLKTVVGKDANKKAVSFLKLIASDPAMSQIVEAGVYVSKRRWDLLILDKVTVKLPAYDAKNAWLVLGKYAREKNLLARPISVIDMRVPKKIFIKMKKKSKKKI
ncbi:MAG: cell division protein FtsQ/DivIB [Alphaproteobacteria bacterium]